MLENVDYALTHFGGDTTSPRTVQLALLAMFVVEQFGMAIDEVIPMAIVSDAAYPVFVHRNGFPRRFGHAKLFGPASVRKDVATGLIQGGCNVGVRVYSVPALARALTDGTLERHSVEEFGLDHIDEWLSRRGASPTALYCIGLRGITHDDGARAVKVLGNGAAGPLVKWLRGQEWH